MFARHPSIVQSSQTCQEDCQQDEDNTEHEGRFGLGGRVCPTGRCFRPKSGPGSVPPFPSLPTPLTAYNTESPSDHSGDGEEEESEEEVAAPLKYSRVMVVTSPPESEEEAKGEDEAEDGDDGQKGDPVTPRSRFLNRKRVLTSDSETDEGTVSAVRPPRKKPRVGRPEVSSGVEVESDQGLFASFWFASIYN